MQTQDNQSGGQEIPLGRPSPAEHIGLAIDAQPRGPDYPDLYLRGDHPGLADIPDSGHATIKFTKQSHEVAKHPVTGKKQHRVNLSVTSIKCHPSSKKTTRRDKNPFAEAPKALKKMSDGNGTE